MKNKFFILITGLMISFVFGEVLGSDCVISKLTGKVEIFKQEKWLPAKIGIKLKQNDKLKTYSTGKVELTFNDGSTIWVKENTELNIMTLLPKDRSVEVKTGQIRVKVTPLKPGDKFSFKTLTAVAAVRGTELILIVSETDAQLLVIAGKIEFTNIISEVKSEIVEGQTVFSYSSGELTPPRDFTPEEVNIINDNSWQNFAPVEPEKGEKTKREEPIRIKIKEDLAELRQELKELVQDAKTDLITIREYIDEIRETDISTGRTLRDHFGNLVRVEQYLFRPDPQTIQVLNLTKRQEYTYKGYFTDTSFTDSARIDSFDASLKFNLAMPDDLADWPSFMMNKGEELEPREMRMEISNGKDKILIKGTFEPTTEPIYEYRYYYDKNGNPIGEEKIKIGEEEVLDFKGDTKYISETHGEWLVDTKDYQEGDLGYYDTTMVRVNNPLYNPSVGGWVASEYENVENGGEDSLWFWGISPKMRLYQNKDTTKEFTPGVDEYKFVYLGTEFYGINNSGNILSVKDFTGYTSNPFAVLKEIAFQNVLFCKMGELGPYPDILAVDDSTDLPERTKLDILNDYQKLDNFFARKNIDLVVTPDLFIPTAQKLITQIDKLELSSAQN